MVSIRIGGNEAGQRVDRFLRKYLRNAPLSAIYRIIRKDLKVDGKRVREDTLLSEGEELSLYVSEEQIELWRKPPKHTNKARKQFRVIYESDQVLIVSKPAGLLVHGDRTEKRNTLANQVCGYLQERGEYDPAREKSFTPAPANRIDRNTSGLVMFGKNAAAARELARLIRSREGIRKFYLALVSGCVREDMVLTDALVKDASRNMVTAAAEGQVSETRVRPVRTGRRFSLVEAELVTGRTHQIRVHLSQAGFPLAADPKYGDPRVNELVKPYAGSGQLLHAWRLCFDTLSQPLGELSGRCIEAPLPKKFAEAAEDLIHG